MKLQVKLFAVASQLVNADEVDVELADSATVRELRNALQTQVPELAHIVKQLMIAVDTQYAGDDQVLSESSEVACIPPVSGG